MMRYPHTASAYWQAKPVEVSRSEWLAAAIAADPFAGTWAMDADPVCEPTVGVPCPQDWKLIKVGSTWYAFYGEGTAPMTIDINFYSCGCDADGLPDDNWVRNSTAVIPHGLIAGFDDSLVSAPCPVALADGSYRLYAHGYATNDRGGVWSASAEGFPDTLTWLGITVDLGTIWDSVGIHNEINLPPEVTHDGKWACIYGGLGAGGVWKGGEASSVTGLPGTYARRAFPVMQPGPTGEFDAVQIHPVGGCVVKNLGALGYAYYCVVQGYSAGGTWSIGRRVSPDRLVWHRLGGALVTPAAGKWIENPGVAYNPANGAIRLYATVSPAGTTDYSIYPIRKTS